MRQFDEAEFAVSLEILATALIKNNFKPDTSDPDSAQVWPPVEGSKDCRALLTVSRYEHIFRAMDGIWPEEQTLIVEGLYLLSALLNERR
jgi:hypothetical protein